MWIKCTVSGTGDDAEDGSTLEDILTLKTAFMLFQQHIIQMLVQMELLWYLHLNLGL